MRVMMALGADRTGCLMLPTRVSLDERTEVALFQILLTVRDGRS